MDAPQDTHYVSAADAGERELLERYLGRRRNDLLRVRSASELEDFETIRRIGHNLHGSGTAYGLRRISLLGERLETAAERAAAGDILQIADELDAFLANVAIRSD